MSEPTEREFDQRSMGLEGVKLPSDPALVKRMAETEVDPALYGQETILSEEKPCELMPTCEVCRQRKSIGVCCVPGVPYSAAYCAECLEAGAQPYFIVVANTCACGGLDQTADWWKELVFTTLAYLHISPLQFDADVQLGLRKEEADFSGQPPQPEDEDEDCQT